MTEEAGLDIFISVSLRYPELNAVKYEAEQDRIILEIAHKGSIIQCQQEHFVTKAKDCLSLFHKLSERKPVLVDFDFIEKSNVTFIRFYRDVVSLSEEEINLFMNLLKDEFTDILHEESICIVTEESFKLQVKNNLLRKIQKDDMHTSNFFSCRDNGRVLVFNE